jgi:putative membrane protein
MSDELEVKDPRTYMSAERTFLSWIRTGVALMAFGFVVARFGVFLREIQQTTHQQQGSKTAVSIYLGLGLVAAGVFTTVASAFKHKRYIAALDRGQFRESFGSTFAFVLVMLLALVGIAMAVVLLTL